MNFEDCLKKDLIKKDDFAKKRVFSSIKKAERFLEAVQTNINAGFFDVAVITGYNSIFCLNQALIFNKGYTEKSHICLIAAVRALYPKEKELNGLLNAVDDMRLTRHKIQYSGYDADQEMSDFVKGIAEDYKDCVKKIIEC
ncbi:MAG: HEPN domain-containing protein [Candidatus Diapherotrites archaeon]|nr:HEPN domain-containing protein [Candidatus Diapherotrites archaeon]